MTRDDLDALIFLSKTHRGIHKDRASLTFKITVSAATLYVACVTANYAHPIDAPAGVVWTLVALVFAIVAWHHFASAQASEQNQKLAQDAEDLVIADLQSRNQKLAKPDKNPRKSAWLWELAFLFLTAITARYLITH